jgi:hexosaminidase
VKAGVNSGVFDPGNPETFKFLEDVLTEVFQLFPGKYVHVGGDEVNKGVKARTWGQSTNCQALMQREGLKNTDELQSWFTKQIQKFVSAHGKTLIGWTEIAEGGMPSDAAIMDWKGGGLEAAQAGHDVVMSPTKSCYLDYYQSRDHSTEPHAIGGFLPVKQVYAFDPIPTNLPAQFQSHILGGQCNLWTEYVASLPHAEYMIFPRACALAEVTWSSKESHDYEDFTRRLQVHAKRLDAMGVNYRKASVETR